MADLALAGIGVIVACALTLWLTRKDFDNDSYGEDVDDDWPW